jgi:hypothetical protein
MVAGRAEPAFAVTENVMVPFPVPEVPFVIVSQDWVLVAVQFTFALTDTVKPDCAPGATFDVEGSESAGDTEPEI